MAETPEVSSNSEDTSAMSVDPLGRETDSAREPAGMIGASVRSSSRSNKAGFNKQPDNNSYRERARSLGAPRSAGAPHGRSHSVGRNAGRSLDEMQCYKCHGFGHIARFCPEGEQANATDGIMHGKGRENGKGDSRVRHVSRGPPKLGNFAGRVKSYNSQNGYGFIECPTLKDQGYHDVFVHHTNWREHFTTGSPVRFDVHLGGKGQPQASNLELDDSQPAAPQSSPVSNVKPDVDLGSFLGVIKSFSEETGYGFISCAALRAQGREKDVFVHHLQIQGLKVGCGVRFEAYLDKKGLLKAKCLTAAKYCKPLCAGAIVVTRESVESPGPGYLAVGSGAAVEVLYVGSAATEDEDWLYVKDTHTGEQGWMSCDAVIEPAEAKATSDAAKVGEDGPDKTLPEAAPPEGVDDKVSSEEASHEVAAAVVSEDARAEGADEVALEAAECEVANNDMSEGDHSEGADKVSLEAANPKVADIVTSDAAAPELADKTVSEAAKSSVDKSARQRKTKTPEEAAAAAKALANELDSESDAEPPCPPPARPCPQADVAADIASDAPLRAPPAAEEKLEPREEKPKEDELAVLAAATPLRNISLGATQSSLEHALAVAEELGLQLLGAGSLPWNYELIDKERRSFSGHLPGALDEKSAQRWLRTIMDDMDEIGWDRPMGGLGRVSRGTKWMVKTGMQWCSYRYGGMTVDPVVFPKWMNELMQVCMPMCGLTDPESWPNSCNLNCYADGSDSLDWHADDEAIFQGRERDCRIISLSLGAERTFELRLADESECVEHRLRLRNGDLLTMEGLTQRHYLHRVPKAGGKMVRLRINLTWRWVVVHDSWR